MKAFRAAADCSAKHIMPNKKLSMSRIKQVLRCYAAGKGTRSIADLLDISRNTMKKYITTFNHSGKTIEEILAMDEPNPLRHFNEKPNPYPSLPKSERRTNLKSIPMLREKESQTMHTKNLSGSLFKLDRKENSQSAYD